MIDPTNPVATPFRVQWATNPKTEYQYRTGVITAADGTEQRHPQNRYPQVSVSYECAALTAAHADRILNEIGDLMNSAVAIRDFRMNGSGVVSADGLSVIMADWASSWAVGVRVIIEDADGIVEHTAVISAADPSTRTIGLGEAAPLAMRDRLMSVGSAVVATLDDEMGGVFHTGSVNTWDVSATSFRGLDPIGGAATEVFPFRHGVRDGISVTAHKFTHALDYQVGRRAEFLGYGSRNSGNLVYQLDTLQLGQSDKERLVSFWCGCRGRWKSFTAPDLEVGRRFRFASDILVVTHLSGNVSQATVNLIRLPDES